jgi:glycosyltransferase involved in cell wall biosynthesis
METVRDERLLSFNGSAESTCFLTIAIPQYKQRQYLEVNLASVLAQTYDDFEIVISDDHSPDDSNEVIPPILERSGCNFRYYAQPANLGYDRNVRFCLSNARGRYAMLLGNDDALPDPETLRMLAEKLREINYPEVALTNYEDWESGRVSRRTHGTLILGSGPETAAHYFRSFSFVSGLVLETASARRHDTDRWDHSIFYQIYLACRIIASGGRLGGLDVIAIRDHIRLEGKLVPGTYRNRYKNAPWTSEAKHTGLDSVARVTADAILPFVPEAERSAILKNIWQQILTISYPFWILEYRGLANWSWGLAIARDSWPGKRLAEYRLSVFHRIYLWLLYFLVTAVALILPTSLFAAVRQRLADFVRRRRQVQQGPQP